jgi:hypothetical protein
VQNPLPHKRLWKSRGFCAKPPKPKRMEPVVAATEAEAIAQATEALGHWLAAAKTFHVTVPGEESGNPWLHACGHSATAPDFPECLEAIQRLRTLDTSA